MNTSVRLWSIAVLACAGTSLAVPAQAASGRSFYKRGVETFGEGNFVAAARLFAKAFAMEPEPAYLFSEASCHRRLGNDEKAATLYERYLELVPSGERMEERRKATRYAASLRLALGLALRDRSDCEAGVRELERSLEHEPARGAPWVHIGLCRERLAEPTLARTAYARALRALKTGGVEAELRNVAESRLAALSGPGDLMSSHSTGEVEPLRHFKGLVKYGFGTSHSTGEVEPPRRRSRWGLIAGIGSGLVAAGIGVVVVVLVAGGNTGGVDVPGSELGRLNWGGW